MKSHKFIISGKVQGVYYRVSVRTNALKSNFNGYVKNLNDGRVEACVTCDDSKLNEFIKILNEGSTASRVTNIQELECNNIYSNKFEVR